MENKDRFIKNNEYFLLIETINNIRFTPREIDIIAYILGRRTAKKIAFSLHISPKTVETHIRNIMQKLECNSRESIINFIEGAREAPLLKARYAQLICFEAFEQSLKEISSQIIRHRTSCILIDTSGEKKNVSLIFQLNQHLNTVGILTEIKDKSELSNIQSLKKDRDTRSENFVIYILSKALGKEIQMTSEFGQLLQKEYDNTEFTILLICNKKTNTNIINSFSTNEQKNTEQFTNYYNSFFELLKCFLPSLRWDEIFLRLKNRSTDNIEIIHPNLSKLQSTKMPQKKGLVFTIKNFLASLAFKSWKTCLMFIVLFFCCFSIYPVFFKNTQKESITRSDLSLPTESVLLQRPRLLTQIDEKLKKESGIQTIALVGIGGAGKTTLAHQYANSQNMAVVWKIDAETKSSLLKSFNDLANALANTPEQKNELDFIQKIRNPEEKEAQTLLFIKGHLKKQPDWLLIFDNVESFSDIKPYFPQNARVWGNGKVIITTRDNNIKYTSYITTENVINVDELNNDEALNLFSKIIYNQKSASLSAEKKTEALTFLKEIPPFPLDIAITAYYINNINVNFDQYLKRIKEYSEDFQEAQKNLLAEVSDYTKTRYAIVTSSVKKVIKLDSLFEDLLLFICLLDSQNIPKNFLDFYASSSLVERFIHELRKYSLLTQEARIVESGGIPIFSLHRSTQNMSKAYLIKLINDKKLNDLTEKYIKTLMNYFEDASQNKLIENSFLLSHIESFKKNLRLLPVEKKLREEYETNLNYLAGYIHFSFLNNLFYAKKYFLEILEKDTSLYHLSKTRLATLLKDLASISVILGDCDQAIAYSSQSLKILTTVSDSVLLMAENYKIMGYAYTHKNDFATAKYYLEKALIQIESLPHEVKKELEAKIYASLGILYSATFMNGEKAELGERYALKALEILNASKLFHQREERKRTPISSYVAVARRILGDIYCRSGEYDKADIYGYGEAQYIVNHSLDDNPQNLLKIELDFCMAEVLIREKKFKEAEENLTRSIEKSERMLGINNTWIALPAKIYRAEARIRQGELEKAYRDCADVIEMMDNKSQTNYSVIIYLTCFYHAAVIKYKQHDFAKSLEYFKFFLKEMRSLCKSLLGEEKFRKLESKKVFQEIPPQEQRIEQLADIYLQRSAEIFVAIYGTSNLFVKDYVLLNTSSKNGYSFFK